MAKKKVNSKAGKASLKTKKTQERSQPGKGLPSSLKGTPRKDLPLKAKAPIIAKEPKVSIPKLLGPNDQSSKLTPSIKKQANSKADVKFKVDSSLVSTDIAEESADPEWLQMRNLHKESKSVSYSMSDHYEVKTVLSHKILGLGFVTKSEQNRIEVLFHNGKKTLITNYKKDV